MGNDASTEYRPDEKQRRGDRITRSSSLRTDRPVFQSSPVPTEKRFVSGEKTSFNNNKPIIESNAKRKVVKRSNTFTAISTFAKPLFQSRLSDDQKSTKRSSKKHSVSSREKETETIENKKQRDNRSQNRKDLYDTTNVITEDDGDDQQQLDINIINDPCTDDETDRKCAADGDELFIPRNTSIECKNTADKTKSNMYMTVSNKNNIHIDTPIITTKHTMFEKNLDRVSSSTHITLSVNKPDDTKCFEESSNIITIDKNNETTVFLANRVKNNTSLDDTCKTQAHEINDSKSSKEERSVSEDDSLKSSTSSINDKEGQNNKMTVDKQKTPDTSEGEEEKRKHCTPAERRRKNVLRSQSMNYHMTRPKLNLQERSISIEESIGTTDSKDDTDISLGNNRRGLGNRRSSDSSLLKEQHVKRSEQFSVMLKQYKQQREKKLSKLSSYGLGVITENSIKEESEKPRFKSRRKNDYIDAWLKDQSQRIDILSDAIRGDSEKVNRLRASFRERPLKCPQKDLLPQRPSTVRLPRRKTSLTALISSSDSEDLDDSFNLRRSDSPGGFLDKNGNIIPKRHSNPLKKQLSDTLLLVDNSFKNIKTKELLHDNERPSSKLSGNTIKFCSTPTSTVCNNGTANNIAVVKPMQITSKSESEENLITVNHVVMGTDNPHIHKAIDHNSTYDLLGDKELINKEERKSTYAQETSKDEHTFEKKPTKSVIKRPTLIRSESLSIPSTMATTSPKQTRKYSEDVQQHTPNECESENCESINCESVNRISESLNKVMGDLKSLRDQDINLAKQLLGLGKSIKDYKNEQNKVTNVILQQEDGDV